MAWLTQTHHWPTPRDVHVTLACICLQGTYRPCTMLLLIKQCWPHAPKSHGHDAAAGVTQSYANQQDVPPACRHARADWAGANCGMGAQALHATIFMNQQQLYALPRRHARAGRGVQAAACECKAVACHHYITQQHLCAGMRVLDREYKLQQMPSA